MNEDIKRLPLFSEKDLGAAESWVKALKLALCPKAGAGYIRLITREDKPSVHRIPGRYGLFVLSKSGEMNLVYSNLSLQCVTDYAKKHKRRHGITECLSE